MKKYFYSIFSIVCCHFFTAQNLIPNYDSERFEKPKDTLALNLNIRKNIHQIDVSYYENPFGYSYLRQIKNKNYLGFRIGLGYFKTKEDIPISNSIWSVEFSTSINYTCFISKHFRLNYSIGAYHRYVVPTKFNTQNNNDYYGYQFYRFWDSKLYIGYTLWEHFTPSLGMSFIVYTKSKNIHPLLFGSIAYQF